MKKKSLILLGITIGVAAITYYAIRRMNTKRMLTKVADEGYETAPDILFPDEKGSSKLHYGPILPQ